MQQRTIFAVLLGSTVLLIAMLMAMLIPGNASSAQGIDPTSQQQTIDADVANRFGATVTAQQERTAQIATITAAQQTNAAAQSGVTISKLGDVVVTQTSTPTLDLTEVSQNEQQTIAAVIAQRFAQTLAAQQTSVALTATADFSKRLNAAFSQAQTATMGANQTLQAPKTATALFSVTQRAATIQARPPLWTVQPTATNQASITDYYVDATKGVDDPVNDGSQTKPWQSIEYALKHQTGTRVVVHVGPGLYNESIEMVPGVSVIGAGPNLTTLVSKGNFPAVSFPARGSFGSDVILSGLKIVGGQIGISLQRAEDTPITITNNWITGNHEVGINVENDETDMNLHIINNLISNNSFGISFSTFAERKSAQNRSIIENNQIVNNQGIAISCNLNPRTTTTTASCAMIIIGNDISGNKGNGIFCMDTGNSNCNLTVVGNVIANNGGAAFQENHYSNLAAKSTLINNLIYGNKYSGIHLDNANTPNTIVLLNDTIVNNSPSGVQGVVTVVMNCIIWGQPMSLDVPTDNVSFSDIDSAKYNGINSNISIDPKFMDATNGNFHLAADSPLVDKGKTSPDLPAVDLDGKPRVSGSTVDLGPYESATP